MEESALSESQASVSTEVAREGWKTGTESREAEVTF